MKVRLHPEARAELIKARDWYYQRSPLASIAFAHAVDYAVSRIVVAPNSYARADHETHKFVLQRFPFNVFYRVGETENRDSGCRTPETKTWLLVQPSLTPNLTSAPETSIILLQTPEIPRMI